MIQGKKYIGELKVGDRFTFPKDLNKRIVCEVLHKHGYITTYSRMKRKCKSFRYYKDVIFLKGADAVRAN